MAAQPEVNSGGRSSRRRNMQANRRRDTAPERALRSRLFADGYRYRCDLRLDLVDIRARPDIVFTRQKVAVFVDGCFWHGCRDHSATPRQNVDYWGPKLDRNRARDIKQTAALREAGWRVLRIWEHEPLEQALEKVVALLELPPSRQAQLPPMSAVHLKLI